MGYYSPIKPVELPYSPYVSGAGEVFFQHESAAVVSFSAYNRLNQKNAGRIVLKFDRFQQSIFGYPNEEPRDRSPLFSSIEQLNVDDHTGCYEVENENWCEKIRCENSYVFPTTTHKNGKRISGVIEPSSLKHYLFCFKETTLEILAEDFTYKIFNENGLEQFFDFARQECE